MRDPGSDTVVELRDPIHGPVGVSRDELAVIDTALFQRLRRVKQLGFAEQVFPGAVHNRFLHSIGAMHLAGRAFDAVSTGATGLDGLDGARLRKVVRLAALLHDIGHAPLSHAAEALMPTREDLDLSGFGLGAGKASHEEVSFKLVADSAVTEVLDEALSPMDLSAAHVATVMGAECGVGSGELVAGGLDHLPLLRALVSGELDVDRMDYLLRDSYFTGVRYGQYDLDWLLSNLIAVGDGEVVRLGLDGTAVPTFEHFLLARYHMFQMVYFHPKSDIYDAMLRRWLDSEGPDARIPADPERFVVCDDAWLMRRLDGSDDRWARLIRQRRTPKLVLEIKGADGEQRRRDLERELKQRGVDGIWLTAKPVLSRYAQSPRHLRTNPLFVRDRQSGFEPRFLRIEEVTDLFDRYERTLRVVRLYVDRSELSRLGDLQSP